MKENNGKLAIVTGASTGIGYELARRCGKDGFDLLVVADEPKINEAARAFRNLGVAVEALEADLATIAGVDKLYQTINHRPVHLLLANAGRGLGGAFLDQDFEEIRRVIDTNITGTIYLVQRIGRDMRAQGFGRILFTGSIAGFMPGAFNAVYNGTKAFIDSFSFALREELRDSEVTVTCLMPGATDTEFFRRADLLDTKIGQQEKDDPEYVAQVGYEAMMEGKGDVVSGWKNKVISAVAAITPSETLAKQHRKQTEPGSAKNGDRKSHEETAPATNNSDRDQHSDGLLQWVGKRPFVTAGIVIAGAGLAYAVGKAVQSAVDPVAREAHVETSILIDKSPRELYEFWRDVRNLPLFMKNLESVTPIDGKRSHWVAKPADGVKVEWDAEIFNEIPNELIGWRSTENADVVNAGTVRFENAPEDRGTYLRVTMNYNPPGGTLGRTVGRLTGTDPGQLVKEDLRRLKQLLETGEVATIAGQSSGRAAEAELVDQHEATSKVGEVRQ